jgi:hypothetical protein
MPPLPLAATAKILRLRRFAEVRASAACGGAARRSNMNGLKRMSLQA